MFGSKVVLNSAVDIIDAIFNDGTLRNTKGSVLIQRREKRKVVQSGLIFFDSENVYAASVSNMPIPIARRISAGGKVDSKELGSIVTFAGDDTSPEIVHQVLIKNLLSEDVMDAYVKEHFLENIAEILSWETCVGKWNDNDTTNSFTMPRVFFPKLKSLIAQREIKRHNFAQELARFFKPEEFDLLTPVAIAKNDKAFASEVQFIIEYSNGENTFEDIANITGIGKTVVVQTIHQLWKRGILSLKYQEIDVTYEAVKKANEPKEQKEEIVEHQERHIDLEESQKEPASEQIEPNEVQESINESLLKEDIEVEPLADSSSTNIQIPENYEANTHSNNIIVPNELNEKIVSENRGDLENMKDDIYVKYGLTKLTGLQKMNPIDSSIHVDKNDEDEFQESVSLNEAKDFDEIFEQFHQAQNDANVSIIEIPLSENFTQAIEKAQENQSMINKMPDEENTVEKQDTENLLNGEEISSEEASDIEVTVEDNTISEDASGNNSLVNEDDVTEKTSGELPIDEKEDASEEDIRVLDDEKTSDSEDTAVKESEGTTVKLSDEIENLDLAVTEVTTLSELMSRLGELQAAQQTIEHEISKKSSKLHESNINQKYDDYIQQDNLLQETLDKAQELLREYTEVNEKANEISSALDVMRSEYEELKQFTDYQTLILEALEDKKAEVDRTIQQVTLYFSSNK